MRFAASNDPQEVVILAAGGATICPCSAPPCPEHVTLETRWEAENLASQRCVRELIGAVGGASNAGTSWLIDAFVATLTWGQIQLVAAHPHVTHLEGNGGSLPP